MKTFYASLAVFALLLLLIFCNGRYVRHATEEMEALLSNATQTEELNEIESAWQVRKRFLSLSVSYEEIKEVDQKLCIMKAALDTGSAESFEEARALAIEALTRIREFEKLSIDNLI